MLLSLQSPVGHVSIIALLVVYPHLHVLLHRLNNHASLPKLDKPW